MTMRLAVATLVLWAALGLPGAARAQAPKKMAHIGVMCVGVDGGDFTQGARALREGLRELGWIETQTINVRVKCAEPNAERLDALAGAFVRDNVDVLVAISTAAALAAGRATRSIPIVMAGVGDPVGTGLVKNLARPERNMTGVSLLLTDLAGKRLELLKEVVPKLAVIGVLHGDSLSSLGAVKEMQRLAPRLGVQLRTALFTAPASAPDRIADLRAGGAQARSACRASSRSASSSKRAGS